MIMHPLQMRMNVRRENMTVLKNKWNARTSSVPTCAFVDLGTSGHLMEQPV
jgi:hypothetical protein